MALKRRLAALLLACAACAAQAQHSAPLEMAQVREHMQAGQYRLALALSAHVAGEHLDEPTAAAQYAWLLHVGAQREIAQRVLHEALQRAPQEASLLRMRSLLSSMPAGVMTGVLIDEQHAIVPAGSLQGASTFSVRNGLGATSRASLERLIDGTPLALLVLEQPIAKGARLMKPPREPFRGSPGFAVDYCGAPDASSQWPLLHVGFFGNIDRDACARASLVFDASGRFSGMLVGEQWVSSAAIDMPVSNEAARRLNADEFYESAMRIAVTLTGV